mmetsp:Transcript_14926/g.22716  ORF Transcript_14926/g.22716 Transcript_14926/m.22716 type:complete len:84 (-) Transcript_14926:110-361(-)
MLIGLVRAQRTNSNTETRLTQTPRSQVLDISVLLVGHVLQGIGANPAATHPAMQVPRAALQAITAAGTPAPAVTVPMVTPAAA